MTKSDQGFCGFDWQEAIAVESFYQPIRTIQNGDLEAGFKQADHIVEGLSLGFLQMFSGRSSSSGCRYR